MKNLFAVLASLAVFAVPATAALKAKEAYLCKMDHVGRDNFIAKELAFWVFPDGSVQVLDGFISHYAGKPAQTKVMQDDAKRLKFRWALNGMEAGRIGSKTGKTKLPDTTYTATFRKATKLFTVRVSLKGYDNIPTGKGTCAPIKR